MVEFVFVKHAGLALDAALLFVVGLFVAWPVVHYRLRTVAAPALAAFRLVLRLMGPSAGIPRMAAVIFGFNTCAIFLYMACGFHPLLPKAFAVWTGLNIGAVMGLGRREEEALSARAAPESWRPAPALTSVCAALVLVVELPCFWFGIAMGVGLGHEVQAGAAYAAALGDRAGPYFAVLAPLLLCSAVAESVAIRGMAGRVGPRGPGDAGAPDAPPRGRAGRLD
ncbi:MAG: hypothetical protein AMK73_05955 [Planctomycetes bacterium SM23_32]|nr:MAG: hypothetical protein AMK73_05955 [Planctomycetes bacterium SM23_32]